METVFHSELCLYLASKWVTSKIIHEDTSGFQSVGVIITTYHFQCAPKNTAEDVGVPQLVLRPSIIWELDEIRQRIFFEDEGKLLVITCPIGDSRRDVQEDLEPYLSDHQLGTGR